MSTGSSDPVLQDGTRVQFKSVQQQMYLSAENGGGARIGAKEHPAGDNETFILQRIGNDTYNLKAPKKQFLGLRLRSADDIQIVAEKHVAAREAALEIKNVSGYLDLVTIKASNGKYVQVKNKDTVIADCEGNIEDPDNPLVFLLNISRSN